MIKKFRVKDLRTNTYLSSYAERGLLFLYETRWVDVGWFIQCEQLESPKRFRVDQLIDSSFNGEVYEDDVDILSEREWRFKATGNKNE